MRDTGLKAYAAWVAGHHVPIDPAAIRNRAERTSEETSALDDVAVDSPTRGRTLLLFAAAVLVIALVATGLAVVGRGEDPRVDTGGPTLREETPADVEGFAAFSPGWHEIDPGPVPGGQGAALAWTGAELVVVTDAPGGDPRRSVHAYDPQHATWRELPALVLGTAQDTSVVWADGTLVAVSDDAAAVLELDGDASWERIDGPPTAAALEATGALGPRYGAGPAIFWSGERVLDATHGAVLDVDRREWSALSMPDDLTGFGDLTAAIALFDGDELVVTTWSTQPGLAWDGAGTSHRTLPGTPPDWVTPGVGAHRVRATALHDSSLVLIAGRVDFPNAATFDATSGEWSPLQQLDSDENCPPLVGATADKPLVAGCPPDQTVRFLDDGAWLSTSGPPHPLTDDTAWLDAGDAFVAWNTSVSTEGANSSERHGGQVWVPPPDPTNDHSPAAPRTPATTPLDGTSVAELIDERCPAPLSPLASVQLFSGGNEALPAVQGVESRITTPTELFDPTQSVDSDGDGEPDDILDWGKLSDMVIERGDGTLTLTSAGVADRPVGLGDLSGDGRDEIGVAVRHQTGGQAEHYVVLGSVGPGRHAVADVGIRLSGQPLYAVVDRDGDGVPELLMRTEEPLIQVFSGAAVAGVADARHLEPLVESPGELLGLVDLGGGGLPAIITGKISTDDAGNPTFTIHLADESATASMTNQPEPFVGVERVVNPPRVITGAEGTFVELTISTRSGTDAYLWHLDQQCR